MSNTTNPEPKTPEMTSPSGENSEKGSAHSGGSATPAAGCGGCRGYAGPSPMGGHGIFDHGNSHNLTGPSLAGAIIQLAQSLQLHADATNRLASAKMAEVELMREQSGEEEQPFRGVSLGDRSPF